MSVGLLGLQLELGDVDASEESRKDRCSPKEVVVMFELVRRVLEALSALIADPSREAQDRALGTLTRACAAALVVAVVGGAVGLVLAVVLTAGR